MREKYLKYLARQTPSLPRPIPRPVKTKNVSVDASGTQARSLTSENNIFIYKRRKEGCGRAEGSPWAVGTAGGTVPPGPGTSGLLCCGSAQPLEARNILRRSRSDQKALGKKGDTINIDEAGVC